jgi:hypothetical protein
VNTENRIMYVCVCVTVNCILSRSAIADNWKVAGSNPDEVDFSIDFGLENRI